MPLPPGRTQDDVQRGLASLRYWLRVLNVMERRQMETFFAELNADLRQKYEEQGDGPIPLHKEAQIHSWVTAHALALAMRHVERRIKRLQSWGVLPPATTDAAHRYLDSYASEELRDLRDALEHSDEYETGGGDHRGRAVVDGSDWLPGVSMHIRRVDGSDSYRHLVSHLSVFGRKYSVEAILEAAHDVAVALGVFGVAQHLRPDEAVD